MVLVMYTNKKVSEIMAKSAEVLDQHQAALELLPNYFKVNEALHLQHEHEMKELRTHIIWIEGELACLHTGKMKTTKKR